MFYLHSFETDLKERVDPGPDQPEAGTGSGLRKKKERKNLG
jgi:hypothetical protein